MICHADGRAFGNAYTAEEIDQIRPMHDLSRFRVAFDDGEVVAVAGSYALDVTLPGGTTMPMGGVTWVSTAATHRRRGLMRQVVEAVHDDIDARGEPVASLGASEGGIYEHLDYGIATRQRVTSIDAQAARMRADHLASSAPVRYVDGDEVVPLVAEIWDRFRRLRSGEVDRSLQDHEFAFTMRLKERDGMSPAFYLAHPDGVAAYRIRAEWNNGRPRHAMELIEFSAVTPQAHSALWQTLLGVDLVGEITSRILPVDDPLPFLLENQRLVRTVELNDGVWVNVRDVKIAFGSRTYRTDDRLVVEVDGKRWAIEGGPDGAACRAVTSKADLVTSKAWFSSLLYGGIYPSSLVAGRRMTARNDDILRRADMFFTTSLAPHCQTHY